VNRKAFSKCSVYLAELRAEFLTASVLPVVVGSALAFHDTGAWHWSLFFWSAVGVALVHSGANVFNDYCDAVSGNDEANAAFIRPFTGGSRLIQENRLTRREVLSFSLALLAAGLAIGLYLAARTGPFVLLLGAIGAVGGLGYSVPRIGLGSVGLGELTVGVLFGILPVLGAYYIQTGDFSIQAVFVSLPLAILIAAVLFINQFQDYRADGQVGKRNWVVRLGLRKSATVFGILMGTWIALLAAGPFAGLMPRAAWFALLPAPLAVFAARWARKHAEHPAELAPANRATIVLNLVVASLLAAALLGARALR
jgi:1,4-dihydroxy-2-naphthoate polyprenyltransferase